MSAGPRAAATGRQLRPLEVEECLARLRRQCIGRLAFLDGTAVRILPMNFAVHEGTVVLRMAEGSTLDAVTGAVVAFEVDAITLEDHAGWSVVVQGRAQQVQGSAELAILRRLPLRPWAPGDRDHFLRITPAGITGRDLT